MRSEEEDTAGHKRAGTGSRTGQEEGRARARAEMTVSEPRCSGK